MVASRLGRLLAPLALVACAAAVFATVKITLDGDEGRPRGDAGRGAGVTEESTRARPAARRDGRRTYTVRPGDVLSVIAERNGVSVEQILRLNPNIDPQSLRAGQRLRLRP